MQCFFVRDNRFFNPVNSSWDPLISEKRTKMSTWNFKMDLEKCKSVNFMQKNRSKSYMTHINFFVIIFFCPLTQITVDNIVPLTQIEKKCCLVKNVLNFLKKVFKMRKQNPRNIYISRAPAQNAKKKKKKWKCKKKNKDKKKNEK